MFFSILTSASLVLALALQAHVHVMPSPALCVKGLPACNDVQRLSTNVLCSNMNIAQNLDTSTTVPAEADGTVMLNITNYNVIWQKTSYTAGKCRGHAFMNLEPGDAVNPVLAAGSTAGCRTTFTLS
ncbi:hypothetical protein B0H10DRAFT_1956733 [Mycena sp. CBHHK59/15]|nr:hypothetical protein B0H10DRAFT_1956733 [Mycena sp. CBHHK59/15]